MFFHAAKHGSNSWWQYLIGSFIVFLGYSLGQVPLGLVVIWAANRQGDSSLVKEFAESVDFSLIGLNPTIGFGLALITFLGALIGLWIAIRYLHNRSFTTLINGLKSVRWSRFFWGASIWFVLGLLAETASWAMNPEAYHWQFEATSFFWLLIIALILIPFQASFEELFVRGYLMQGIGLGTGSPVFAMISTSLIFACLHLMNPEITAFGLTSMITYYVIVGLFLAIITVMDDGLELAMGVHTATNLFGSILITFEGSALQTPALIKLDTPDVQIMLYMMILTAIIFVFIASRKYGWTEWNKLSSPIRSTPTGESMLDEDESEHPQTQ